MVCDISSSFASPPVRFRLRVPVFRRQPKRLSSVHRGLIARMPSPRTSAASSGVIGPRFRKASSTRRRRVSTREEIVVAASSLVSSSRWPGVGGTLFLPPGQRHNDCPEVIREPELHYRVVFCETRFKLRISSPLAQYPSHQLPIEADVVPFAVVGNR